MNIFKKTKGQLTKKRTKKERSKKITFYMVTKGEEDQVVTVVPSKEDYLQAIDVIARRLYDEDYQEYCKNSHVSPYDNQEWLDFIKKRIKYGKAQELDEYSVSEVTLTVSELCSLLRTFTFSEPLNLDCEEIGMEHFAFELLEELCEKIAGSQEQDDTGDTNNDASKGEKHDA